MEISHLNLYSQGWGRSLAEDSPCGEDCSFSSEFEAIRAEVDKDASLHVSEPTDWAVVSKLAFDFLNNKSKDIWVLAYAVYAEYRLHDLSACPAAFSALTRILDAWWDELHPGPKRVQRRLAPLFWLCGKMEHAAETTCFMDGAPATIRALQEEFARLQGLLEVKVGEAAPNFAHIFKKIPSLSPAPPVAAPATREDGPASACPAAASSIAASLADMEHDSRIPATVLPQLVRNILDQTRQLAGHFLALNVLDERAYLLHRAALWGTLLQLPQADASGKTQLTSGVPPDRVQSYTAAVDGKQYAEVLPHLERSAGKAPFWLDGHSMVVRCLEGLNAPQAAAHVRDCLASLLRRFPDLLTYTFKDGAPFASQKIVPWLDSLSPSANQGGFDPSAHCAGKGGGGVDEDSLLQEAVAVCVAEGFQAGLFRLGPMASGRSRDAVLHGVLQARYCLAVNRKGAAARMLASLYAQMERWGQLDWEPELTARILSLLLSSQGKNTTDATEEMIGRLYLLNVEAALTLVPEH